MRFIKKSLFLFLFVFASCGSLLSIADWTTLVYVQAKNNLNKFAAKNLADMSSIGSNNNLNILVQWYQPNQKGIWRYKIEKNKIDLDTYLPSDTDGNHANDLVDSVRWAATKYAAKNYCLVLWNHGVGILDPTWGALHGNGLSINSSILDNNPRIQLEDLTTSTTDLSDQAQQVLDEQEDFTERGILFNENSRTYMTNQELVEAMRQIKTNVLHKKLDILGMDACLMAMVEMAYQVKDYANYMVASQEVELAHGWDYITIMSGLAMGRIAPAQLAQSIVLSYENFYRNRIQFYTQSAIVLENIGYVRQSLDQIVSKINLCKKYDKPGMTYALREARRLSLQFSARNYIDLHSFYSRLVNSLETKYKISSNTGTSLFLKYAKELNQALNAGMKLIENAVMAYTAGSSVTAAKGLSIYFPQAKVDSSYIRTNFAQESLWSQFLQDYLSK